MSRYISSCSDNYFRKYYAASTNDAIRCDYLYSNEGPYRGRDYVPTFQRSCSALHTGLRAQKKRTVLGR